MLRSKANEYNTFAIILVLAFGLFILYAGWYLYQTRHIDHQLHLAATRSADPYVGWQTYTAPDHSFSLRLPGDWGITNVTEQCSTDTLAIRCISFYHAYKTLPIVIQEDRSLVPADAEIGNTHACGPNSKIETPNPVDGYPVTYVDAKDAYGNTTCQVYELWVGYVDITFQRTVYAWTGSPNSYTENVTPETFNKIVRSVRILQSGA